MVQRSAFTGASVCSLPAVGGGGDGDGCLTDLLGEQGTLVLVFHAPLGPARLLVWLHLTPASATRHPSATAAKQTWP